jgi:hypothetical protein
LANPYALSLTSSRAIAETIFRRSKRQFGVENGLNLKACDQNSIQVDRVLL